MEVSLPKTLVNSISCFSSLSSSNTVKANLVQRYYQKIKETLELLKLVFEEVIVSELASDDKLDQVLQDIDESINEARELIENWHQMTSKVFFVMQIESVITKLRTLALGLEAFWLLNSLSPSLGVDSTSTCIESCIENIQQIHYEPISYIIKEAIRDQLDRTAPRTEHLEKISKSLSLLSNQELLMEAVALDKMKTKVTRGESHAEMESFDQLIALINYMHDCYVKIKQLDSINGVPIPADFCCPLSLELMSDPVIVASGQTYERAFIKQWLDQGFNVCPKTRQTLGHTNLIPNYTVKALIANWCELNDIKIPDPIKSLSLNMPPIFLSSADTNVYNASDICGSNHSPKKNLSKSPDRLTNGSISTNGTLEENHMHDEPLQTDSGIEASIARMSLPNSEEKKEAHSEERYTSSSSQTPNQLEDYHSEDQVVDEQSGGHSRSASASSAVSDNGYLQGAGDANSVARISSDLSNHTNNNVSGEVSQNSPAAFASPRESEFLPRLSETRSRSQAIWRRSSERFVPRMISSQSMESRPDLSGVETQVRKLIEDLKSDSVDVQRDATAELRLLAKHNMDNRIVIANCGAINLLVGFLHSTDLKIQENAVTALLNLSINDNNKAAIANADAIDPLIHVLETGNTEAKENSAATLFSLSVIEENKVRIGRSRAIKPLVELLGSGTPRGKKDASTALFNLSIFPENKARIVQAGAVRHLVELMDPAAGMVDKAVAVLANLATIPEGRNAIGHEGGIPVLVEVVELGSARGKENAAAALLQLCTNSNRFCSQVLKEGAVPPLVALSQTGTARAKEKAQTLLSHFRNQRHGGAGRP